MARRAHLTKGYSDFNDVPSQEGSYAYEPEQNVKWYVVETTTVERLRVPSSAYSTLDGTPLKQEFLREYIPKNISNDYHEGYESYHGLDYEHESPPYYYGDKNLVADFLNKIQIEASRPANMRRPTSPKRYHPTSSYKHRSTSPNSYQPTSPDKYQVVSPISYQPISPTKYQHTSPTHNYPSKEAHLQAQTLSGSNKYQPLSSNMYPPTSPTIYMPTSSMKYRPTSPKKYRPTSPKKYRPTSPDKYRPMISDKYQPTSPNKYRSSSPTRSQHTGSPHNYPSKEAYLRAQPYPESTKYLPTSPNKYQPTSPNKYLPTSPSRHHPTSPSHKNPSKEVHPTRPQNYPGLKKYQPTSPTHSFCSSEGQPIQTQNLSSPDKHHPSSPMTEGGRHITSGIFLGQNDHWRSGGIPTTRHHLTTPTNDIDEALSYMVESVNYSTWSNPRAQSFDHERRYTMPTFEDATTQSYVRSNTIDSHEAIKRYNGAYVP